MPADDPLVEALTLLRKRKDEAIADLRQLEIAIASIERLLPAAGDSQGFLAVEPSIPEPPKSVRTMMQELLDESDRDWSVFEIIAEYQRRGNPVHGKDPDGSVRAALNDANKAKRIERTAPGRYKSTLWQLGPEKGGMSLR